MLGNLQRNCMVETETETLHTVLKCIFIKRIPKVWALKSFYKYSMLCFKAFCRISRLVGFLPSLVPSFLPSFLPSSFMIIDHIYFYAITKWCISGRCEHTGVLPIDGGWSEWSSYTNCSRECGGGLQYRQRKCDNPK